LTDETPSVDDGDEDASKRGVANFCSFPYRKSSLPDIGRIGCKEKLPALLHSRLERSANTPDRQRFIVTMVQNDKILIQNVRMENTPSVQNVSNKNPDFDPLENVFRPRPNTEHTVWYSFSASVY
jgi:hypothetical protein